MRYRGVWGRCGQYASPVRAGSPGIRSGTGGNGGGEDVGAGSRVRNDDDDDDEEDGDGDCDDDDDNDDDDIAGDCELCICIPSACFAGISGVVVGIVKLLRFLVNVSARMAVGFSS